MNILIISRTPWSLNNSFGNTFSNLFAGMGDVTIYHISCQKGETSDSLAKAAIQLTDSSVLKSILGKDAAFRGVLNQSATQSGWDISNLIKGQKAKRNPLFHIIRDLIWKLAPIDRSKTLNDFLNNTKLDLIYLPIYSSCYMCDFQMAIVKKLRIPVVAHISDDEYKENTGYSSKILASLYQKMAQKKIRELISYCAYMDVFAQNMKVEYERLFGKPCYIIGKGVRIEDIPATPIIHSNNGIRVIYTGNLGTERYKIIAAMGRAFDRKNIGSDVVLEVYTRDIIDKKISKEFQHVQSIKVMGALTAEEAKEVQKAADYLLHVESFSEESIVATRMSFSTKIIDYMMSGNAIIAIGPAQVNSISLLKEKRLAIVADTVHDLDRIADLVVTHQINRQALFHRVRDYLESERNLEKIQKDMKERMKALCLDS